MERFLAGRYRIVSAIGHGGMGVVYLARDTTNGQNVAVKVLRPELRHSATTIARFEREAALAASIGHPGICPVLDTGRTAEGDAYLVMPSLMGRTLKELVNGRSLDETRAATIACRILEAVAAAHALGIVHRDLKPSNVFVLRDDEVRVLDFGVCKLMGDQAEHLTVTGFGVGTVAYMAPEQALGYEVDHRADIYAVGVLLYEMLTGAHPLESCSTEEMLDAMSGSRGFPVPSSRNPLVGEHLERVVLRALQRDPIARYPNALEMHEELAQIQAGHSSRVVASTSKTTAALPVEEPSHRGNGAQRRRP